MCLGKSYFLTQGLSTSLESFFEIDLRGGGLVKIYFQDVSNYLLVHINVDNKFMIYRQFPKTFFGSDDPKMDVSHKN